RGWVLLAYDETECWVAWHYKIPAVSVPMLCQWDPKWAKAIEGLEVLVWPPNDGMDVTRIAEQLPGAKLIEPPDGMSLTEAHQHGRDIPYLLRQAKLDATPIGERSEKADGARIVDLEAEAQPVLAAKDPLAVVRAAIKSLGYGGDIRTVMLVYLAV